MENRIYNFANELSIDFGEEVHLEEYHVFNLDMYEHSSIHFSITWTGTHCRFDTSNNIWFIAVPKSIYPDEEEARWVAETEIEVYNKYVNWYVYYWREERKELRTNSPWQTRSTWEYADSCGWYYDIKDILDEHGITEAEEITDQ